MIVITTPTGDIGHQALDNILKTAAGAEHIRVIIRDPATLPVHTRDRVEVVQGSHFVDRSTKCRAVSESWVEAP